MATEILTEIALDAITPDPANPRGKLRGIDELAANVKLNGILQPITVREIEPKGLVRYMIVFGERRWAAAKKAGLSNIPALLDGDGDVKVRTIHRLVENVQRDDFSAVERAKGIQAALDLGIPEKEVADGLSVSVDHVAAASVIAKAPLAAKAVAKETEALNLTFDQALGLAEFSADEGVYSNLMDVIKDDPGSWDYEIESYRQARVRDAALKAAFVEWTKKGYQVLESLPYNVAGARRLDALKGNGAAGTLTSAPHRSCPGRAVWLIQDYDDNDVLTFRVSSEYCMDFAANGHEEISPRTERQGAAPAAKTNEAVEEAKTLERRTNLAMIAAGKIAQTVRREFMVKLLARKSAPAGTLRFAAEQLCGGRPGYRPGFYERFAELSGTKDTALRGSDPATVVYVKRGSDAHIPLGMLAYVAAEIEGAWEANTWARRDSDRTAYLGFLVERCGYTPSLVEKVALGKAKPADVLKDQDARRAAKKAGK
jgi:ParB family chromosome partitioning protein